MLKNTLIKKVWLLLLIIPITGISATTQRADSLTRTQFIHLQTAKADSLNKLALSLASSNNTSPAHLNQAISYIMQGLHIYSKFKDTIGLRQTFDHLGLVYGLQKKYTQAKWFILQSNTLSRQQRDTPQIINSLINLASVKKAIKDYKLADKDIREAAMLAKMFQQEKMRIHRADSMKSITAISDTQLANSRQKKTTLKKQASSQSNYLPIIISVFIVLFFIIILFLYNYRKNHRKK